MNKSLLLVVDVQRGFMNKYTQPVVAPIRRLATAWHAKDWPVACSRFINLPDSNWRRLRDWDELGHEPETLLAEDLKINTPHIFKKGTYSAWSEEVMSLCLGNQISDVVLAGVDTNECVLATAISVFDAGFTPWIVADACASTGGDKPHDMALTLLRALLGTQQVITTKEVL